MSRAYVPHARVLARSFAEQHPDGEFWALLIDDLDQEIVDQDEPFRALRLHDLDVEPAELHRMAMLFGNRLIAAIKPWVFDHFLRNGSESIIYIDSDFQIFDSLGSVADGASEHGVVVVPHVISPVPRDGLQPDETTILGVGTFNAGFFAVGRPGAGFVRFLMERLRRECHTDVPGMRVNEQRWLDFVPALFDHLVLRDPGIDAAPWNMHERPLTHDGDRYLVAGQPLRAFHFSGFDPRIPEVLSARDYWEEPRVPVGHAPALARLCRDYSSALFDAGFETLHRTPFAFDFLPDGTPVFAGLRHLYRDALLDAEANGASEPPDPFDGGRTDEFREWALESFAGVGQRPPQGLTRRGSAPTTAEDWIGRMQVGHAGTRASAAAVTFDRQRVGGVLTGPNALLGVGRYRATVDVWLDDWPAVGTEQSRPLLIEAMSDGYALGGTAVSRSGRSAATVEFVVPPRLHRTGLSAGVQLRIATQAEVGGAVHAVLVERIGDIDGRTMAETGTEWLPSMSVGDAGEWRESEVVTRSGRAGVMVEGPRWRLDAGRYRAELGIRAVPGSDDGRAVDGSTVLAVVEAVIHGYVLAFAPVTTDDLTAGTAALEFDVAGRWGSDRYTRVELRIRAQTETAAVLDAVRVMRIGDAAPVPTAVAGDWLPALSVGEGGQRLGSEIHSVLGRAGVLAHGPGWRLAPGRYRVDVTLESLAGGGGADATAFVLVLCDGVGVGRGQVVFGHRGTGGPTQSTCSIAFEVRERSVPPPLLRLAPLVDLQIVAEDDGRIAVRSVTVSREEPPA